MRRSEICGRPNIELSPVPIANDFGTSKVPTYFHMEHRRTFLTSKDWSMINFDWVWAGKGGQVVRAWLTRPSLEVNRRLSRRRFGFPVSLLEGGAGSLSIMRLTIWPTKSGNNTVTDSCSSILDAFTAVDTPVWNQWVKGCNFWYSYTMLVLPFQKYDKKLTKKCQKSIKTCQNTKMCQKTVKILSKTKFWQKCIKNFAKMKPKTIKIKNVFKN